MSKVPGKTREDSHWQLGWWELHPLIDRTKRPIAWSKSSVIFSPHPTQPLVLARHFASSRQFVIPSPTYIVTSPAAYDPPTVISVSPNGDWLFAYFPSREDDGVACLWKRASQLDHWSVQDSWTTSRGAGIVTAEWTNHPREWVVGESGIASRLPSRGPNVPVNSSVLLLVTQSLYINACFLPPCLPNIKRLKAPLTVPSLVKDNEVSSSDFQTAESQGGRRLCVSAAIGLCYNDMSLLVATRSHLLPSYQSFRSTENDTTMDIGLPMDLGQPPNVFSDTLPYESDVWGEETVIDVFEVGINVDSANVPSFGSRPLPPLFFPHPYLTDLTFIPVPPESPASFSPSATKDPRRATKDSPERSGSLYLVATVLDCGDYTTAPKSEMTVYSCVRNTNPTSKTSVRWMINYEHHRIFDTGVVAFLAPAVSGSSIVVSLLDTTGTARRSQGQLKEVPIGTSMVLQLPTLDIDERWDTSHILTTSDRAGRDVPAGIVHSPNGALLYCISSSAVLGARTSVHTLPKRQTGMASSDLAADLPRSDLSRPLCSAILSRRSPSDIIHVLCLPSTTLSAAVCTLYITLRTLSTNSNGLGEMWLTETVGVIVEVYLGKSRYSQGEEKANLVAQWKAAHDICSIEALNSAFEDCREGDAYDLEAIWQLVGLSVWFVGFLERLMKECVAFSDGSVSAEVKQEPTVFTEDITRPLPLSPAASPILIHLVHLHAFRHMLAAVQHVKKFRDHIASLSAKGENAQIARDVLMDAIDHSGIRLDSVIPVLTEVMPNTGEVTQDELRRCLTLCAPTPLVVPFLRRSVKKIVSSGMIDRPKLFIKVADLVDGISQLTLVTSERADAKETDVITKGILLHGGAEMCCVRCGGRSELGRDLPRGIGIGPGHISVKWRVWERTWATRCVCGGAWTRPNSA